METACLILISILLSCLLMLTWRIFQRDFTAARNKPNILAFHEAIVEGVMLSERCLLSRLSANDVDALFLAQAELEQWELKILQLTRFEVVDYP
ncbi:hypothetical protein [Alteromonas sp. a30]|uniref:hypothetical protein n=1 Tax=Alteromonas sp. a30 TaxID=2730917 RepID=UPI00227E39E7|nr:hypothetical protein [Alteromonas sp. a30]MCY7295835.1 hypothetical protein [Alteromonas sp. a30]